MHTQIMTQEELENHSLSEGKERFWRRVQYAQQHRQVATAGGATTLLAKAIEPTAQLMELTLDAKKRGARHLAMHLVPIIGTEVTAFITARVALNGLLVRMPVNTVAAEIADLLMDELKMRRYKAEAPGVFEARLKRFVGNNYKVRARQLKNSMKSVKMLKVEGDTVVAEEKGIETDDLTLTMNQRLVLGVWCLDHFLRGTKLLTVETLTQHVKGKIKKTKLLVAEADTLEWLQQRTEAMELLWPVALPMVEPPLPWGPNGQRGGYRYALKNKFTMVRGVAKEDRRVLNTQHMPVVYEALNAIQRTPWRIQSQVLEVLQAIIERGGDIAGVPKLLPEDPPKAPKKDEALEAQRKADREALKATGYLPPQSEEMRAYLKEWKRYRKEKQTVMDDNHEKKYTRLAYLRLLSQATMFAQYPAIYYVYNLDFRGRIYPVVSSLLSPQGDDRAKALLTFAEGRPLGRDGFRYLAQHTVSCLDTYGGVKLTKRPIAERVQWVEDHMDWLVQQAEDPFVHRGWMEADSPFQFLAACFELQRLQAWLATGEPRETFVSGLPCAMDGSCNGLQHFSAMLKDPIGGAAVNLMPSSEPKDIYSTVLTRVLDLLEQDAGNPTKQLNYLATSTVVVKGGKRHKAQRQRAGEGVLAMKWLTSGLVDRKLVKRPVMTYPYGSRAFGFSQQIIEHLMHLESGAFASKMRWAQIRKDFDVDGVGDTMRQAAQYLAGVIMQGIEGTVVAAADAMAWFQACARLAVKSNQCVTWSVPVTNFKVRQAYYRHTVGRVKTMLLGHMYQPRVKNHLEAPHAVKQANAVSPNVVHSLDAAALMLTVKAALRDGVGAFGMVHDSYATVPGDAALLALATRSAFVRLYTAQDVMQHFADQFAPLLPEGKALPMMPQKGTLDLGHIHASEFFFA